MIQLNVNAENEWRLKGLEVRGWARGVRPGAAKYFIVSVDSHLMPPVPLFRDRLDKKWHQFLPRVEKRANGERYIVMAGARDERLIEFPFTGDGPLRPQSGGGQ